MKKSCGTISAIFERSLNEKRRTKKVCIFTSLNRLKKRGKADFTLFMKMIEILWKNKYDYRYISQYTLGDSDHKGVKDHEVVKMIPYKSSHVESLRLGTRCLSQLIIGCPISGFNAFSKKVGAVSLTSISVNRRILRYDLF